MPLHKGLVCVLELHIREVTCPGVCLKSRDDLYVSAYIFGQYKKTSCVRAIFPLIFEEKLVFEKVYTDVVDPGDLVEQFELDTAVLELIQTCPPVGESLATYEENTRDFLFPEPKFKRRQQGSDREVLMRKAPDFTGIAPKLTFFTSCLISEISFSEKAPKQDNLDFRSHSSADVLSQRRSPKKNTPSPERNRQCLPSRNYEQPTIASLSHSPSPYTKRRMCQLAKIRERLAHLNIGPFEFRKETDKPPFVVRHAQTNPSSDPHARCRPKDNIKDAWCGTSSDPTLLGSYRPKNVKMIKSHHVKDPRWIPDDFPDRSNEHLISRTHSRPFDSSRLHMYSAPSSLKKCSSALVLNRSSLRDRSCTPDGEEIHKRVKKILSSHSARQKLTFDESVLSKGESAKTQDSHKTEDSRENQDNPDILCVDSFSNSNLSRYTSQQSIMVHLDNGEYWTNRAAEYKGKSHRAIFEDSLEKIYRNMYKKASSTVSNNKE